MTRPAEMWPSMTPYIAFGFLFHAPSMRVLLHRRAPNAAGYPDRWSFFGGKAEAEDARDPIATWCRELREELGITVEAARVQPLRDYASIEGVYRYVFFIEWPELSDDFVLGEGVGFQWFDLENVFALPDMSDQGRDDLLFFQARLTG